MPSSGADGNKLTPRQRRRAEKWDRILDAAELLAFEHGIDGLTMARLAAAIDVTAGALYRYFDSKEQLIALLQLRALKTVRATLAAKLKQLEKADAEGACDDAEFALAGLLAATEVHAALATEQPHRFALMAIGLADPRTLSPDEDAAKVWASVQLLLADVMGLLGRATKSGALTPGDARRRALVFVMGAQGLLQLGKMNQRFPDLPPMVDMAKEIAEALLASWGAQPALIERATRLLQT